MYYCGPLHMYKQKQDDQPKPTCNSSVPLRDVAPKTYRKQWTIGRGGERGSGISVLMARHDDDVTVMTNWIEKITENHVIVCKRMTIIEEKSSSSSCRAISMDIPDPLSPRLPIVQYFRQILSATSRIGTELLYVG